MAATHAESEAFHFAAILARERPRLVGLCATLAGNRGVAEDLAQETLYEAWKHQTSLLDSERCTKWLSGIARNVCRRWRQHEGRAAYASLPAGDELSEAFTAEIDIEADLERVELVTLLDRALALLPVETRAVLIGSYVEEAAHREIARRLGLSEGAVRVRLHRGKLALRRLLQTDLKESAEDYGLAPPTDGGWDQTPIWCTFCGTRRLIGRLRRELSGGEFALRCPACIATSGMVYHQSGVELLGRVTRYKPALARIAMWAKDYFSRAVRQGTALCRVCGGQARVRRSLDARAGTAEAQAITLYVECPACDLVNTQSLEGLILALPESQTFWRSHPRMRTLPPRVVETDGRLALVTRFESVLTGARLDVLSACDTLDILGIYPDARV